ncbi:MAG: hypothetical protein MUF40_01525 [Gemmatimonadaceae bacterium]|nr:hypothetical protein [Gemmatimonadaceae bacterium]
MTRAVVATVVALAVLGGCRPGRDDAARADSTASREPPPIAFDTGGASHLELWTLAPGRRAADDARRLRRIVEHLHADVAIAPGFVEGALLAAGDGRRLAVLLRWRDPLAAERARPVLAGWFDVRPGDTTRAGRARGDLLAPLVAVRRVALAPLAVADSGVLVLARFARKPEAAAGVFAPVLGDDLAAQVTADPAVRGGTLLLTADSTVAVTVVQARAVNGLELPPAADAPLPAWAPFATRERWTMAVVTVVRQRDTAPVPSDAPPTP